MPGSGIVCGGRVHNAAAACPFLATMALDRRSRDGDQGEHGVELFVGWLKLKQEKRKFVELNL